jgi:F-type H+-transporting ATPase subunit b
MRIDWWTLGLQAVNVVVLVWLLGRFLFRPVAAIVQARQAAIAQALEAARASRAAAEDERDRAAAEAARLAASRDAQLKAAGDDAQKQHDALLAAARAEADQLRAAAAAEIARSRAAEARAAADRASLLAVDIAAKLLDRLPEEARIAGFIDGLAEALARLPEASRAEIAAAGAPLRLRAARALGDAEAERCRARLADALGRPVAIDVEPDPSLIAGLEIDTPHAVVRNSFRADLDRIAGALTTREEAAS